MSIPTYDTIMLPLLRMAADKKDHNLREATEKLAVYFKLNESERKELLPSGKQLLFDNRVGWARTYLKKACLVDIPKTGFFIITDRGIQLLGENPAHIDKKLLFKYPEFRDFMSIKPTAKEPDNPQHDQDNNTPKELLENSFQQINNELSRELLQELNKVSPQQFEQIVIDLLSAMGYGGTRKEAAQAIGGVGDEGVDGVISEDRLGLSKIYVQAKRWQNTIVGHPEIRNFSGALDFKHAEKGIFITTSSFSKDAYEAVERSSKRIILIDGIELAKLMIEYDTGVYQDQTFIVKRLDTDYFMDE